MKALKHELSLNKLFIGCKISRNTVLNLKKFVPILVQHIVLQWNILHCMVVQTNLISFIITSSLLCCLILSKVMNCYLLNRYLLEHCSTCSLWCLTSWLFIFSSSSEQKDRGLILERHSVIMLSPWQPLFSLFFSIFLPNF